MRNAGVRGPTMAALLAVGASLSQGCALASSTDSDSFEASQEAVVDIPQSSVKKQTVGNCWMYAVAGWAESLSMQETGRELDLSEAYWLYWHLFEQIVSGQELSASGEFERAADLIGRYGVMREGAFTTGDSSAVERAAVAALSDSMARGALSTEAARSDRSRVRRELDRAFSLSSAVSAQLGRAFGEDASRTFENASASPEGTDIVPARGIPARVRDPQTKQSTGATLEDALGIRSWWSGRRNGLFAWRLAAYPKRLSERRALLARVQEALHDGQPVLMSWYVDFNAVDAHGRFSAPPTTPGRQGGHMVVLDDYQVRDVPGFGTLKAGVRELRATALEAALAPTTTIEFFRAKNSWGTTREAPELGERGYYDVTMKYLDGPIQRCEEGAEGAPCVPETPLASFVLPAGY